MFSRAFTSSSLRGEALSYCFFVILIAATFLI